MNPLIACRTIVAFLYMVNEAEARSSGVNYAPEIYHRRTGCQLPYDLERQAIRKEVAGRASRQRRQRRAGACCVAFPTEGP